MIEKEDITELSKIADLDWLVKDHIDEIELATISKDYDYLLINYDIVENLSEEFYKIIANTRLKAISTDIAGMDLAKPKAAKESGIPQLMKFAELKEKLMRIDEDSDEYSKILYEIRDLQKT